MISRLKYWIFCFIVFWARLLPDRFLYWCALRVADINYYCDRRGREAVKSNLRKALPDATEKRIHYESRWVFRNFGKYLTEFFRFRTLDKEWFGIHATLIGKEHIDEALQKGRGAIGVSAHLSNWELGGAILARQFNYPVTAIAAMHRDPRVSQMFQREREAAGIRVVGIDEPLKAMQALKANGFVGIIGDRDPTGTGVEIEFFGGKCRFPIGPARLALATGAALIPGHAVRRSNDSFCVEMFSPIPVPESGTRDEKVVQMTQGYAKVLEEAIRRHPEEWAVFYPIFEAEWRPQ